MNKLFDNSDTSPFGLPNAPGVYAVCISKCKGINEDLPKERIMYIGSSKNMKNRVLNPKHPYRLCYDRFSGEYIVYVKSICTEDYINLETILIKEYKPLLNKNGKI